MVDKSNLRFFGIFILVVVVFSIYFVFASHTITTSSGGTSFSVNESTNNLFNITVNNTDAGQASNITSVNITLPSGASCVFEDGSNASSVGSNGTAVADTFVNVSNTLSWTDTTGYVINGSEWKYFWFNVTCATPGTFNITVRTTNITDSYETNLSFEVNDTTAPNITLISPANATSSTTSAYNFTFNVSDDSDVSNCSLILDGSVINTLTSVSKTATNGMYNSSLSVATHTWSINCTDSFGNIGNSSSRTLIVTSATTTPDTTPEESSSSAYTSFWKGTHAINQEQFQEGYSKQLYVKNRIRVSIDNEYHYVGVVELTDTTATINVSSTPMQVILTIGQDARFDINEDDIYDIFVKLNSIENNKVDITIQGISEAVSEGEESPIETEGTIIGEDLEDELEKERNLTWLWILISIVVAVIIGWFIIKKRNKKGNLFI